MLNIHLIYVSSLETGDVEISRTIYNSFTAACEDVNNVIHKYVTDRKADKNYKILPKDEFNLKKLTKDTEVVIGGYFFKKKKSTVNIFKKVLVEGKVWNSYKIEKIGKIGILSEISIPVDEKLLQMIIPSAPIDLSTEKIKKIDIIPIVQPNNQEDKQYVSFVQELKERLERLEKKRQSISTTNISPRLSRDVVKTDDNFVNSLIQQKNQLKHITPSPSPISGVCSSNFSDDDLVLHSSNFTDDDLAVCSSDFTDDLDVHFPILGTYSSDLTTCPPILGVYSSDFTDNDCSYDSDFADERKFQDNVLYEAPLSPSSFTGGETQRYSI